MILNIIKLLPHMRAWLLRKRLTKTGKHVFCNTYFNRTHSLNMTLGKERRLGKYFIIIITYFKAPIRCKYEGFPKPLSRFQNLLATLTWVSCLNSPNSNFFTSRK